MFDKEILLQKTSPNGKIYMILKGDQRKGLTYSPFALGETLESGCDIQCTTPIMYLDRIGMFNSADSKKIIQEATFVGEIFDDLSQNADNKFSEPEVQSLLNWRNTIISNIIPDSQFTVSIGVKSTRLTNGAILTHPYLVKVIEGSENIECECLSFAGMIKQLKLWYPCDGNKVKNRLILWAKTIKHQQILESLQYEGYDEIAKATYDYETKWAVLILKSYKQFPYCAKKSIK